MRILFITPLFLPRLGGLEMLTAELLAGLRSRGHEVSLLTAHLDEAAGGRAVVDGIDVLRSDIHQVLRDRDTAGMLRMRRETWQLVDDFRPDVIHGHDASPNLWLYLRGSRRTRRPVLFTLHNVMSRQYEANPGGVPGLATMMREVDWVTGVSQDVVDDALALEPSIAARVSIVPNGVAAPPREPVPVPDGPASFLAVGRLTEQKGFERAIEAVGRLAATRPDLHLTVAGDGPRRAQLEALPAALGITDRVTFLGAVPHDELPALLARSVALVMPSRYEGLPLVALEAAWSARPVVGTTAPGLDRAVTDGETGLLVDGDDPGALAAAIGRLAADRALARRLGAGARRRAEREWSLATCIDRYEAAYRRLCSPPS
jgi:glycogen(starch) synthase